MSYTAPAGNEASFKQTGVSYTAPVGDAADFQWLAGIPTFALQSKTTTSFSGRADAYINFALESTTAFVPETPFRAFAIGSVSTPYFVTDLRAFDIQSPSVVGFRSGVQALVYSGSTPGFVGFGLFVSAYSLPSTSAVDGDAAWQADAAFSSASNSRFRPGPGYIKDLRFVVRTDSEPRFRSVYTQDTAFVSTAKSLFAFSGTGILGSAFSVPTASSVGATGKSTPAGAYQMSGGSDGDFYGLLSMQGTLSANGYSSVAFASSYTYSEITPIDRMNDCIYSLAGTQKITVRTP